MIIPKLHVRQPNGRSHNSFRPKPERCSDDGINYAFGCALSSHEWWSAWRGNRVEKSAKTDSSNLLIWDHKVHTRYNEDLTTMRSLSIMSAYGKEEDTKISRITPWAPKKTAVGPRLSALALYTLRRRPWLAVLRGWFWWWDYAFGLTKNEHENFVREEKLSSGNLSGPISLGVPSCH